MRGLVELEEIKVCACILHIIEANIFMLNNVQQKIYSRWKIIVSKTAYSAALLIQYYLNAPVFRI